MKAADTGFALRFLRLLTMPVAKTAAFKKGIIDKDYKKIKQPETSEEKGAYTLFHKLVFNVKKLIRNLPFGKLTLSSYLAALWLIKDHTELTADEIGKVLKEATGINVEDIPLTENTLFINKNNQLNEGTYILNKNLLLPINGDELILKGSKVLVKENCNAIGNIFGTAVYKVYHPNTKNLIHITQGDITDA